MRKIGCKICPNCGLYNGLNITKCECGQDMSHIPGSLVDSPVPAGERGELDETRPFYVQKCSFCGALNISDDPDHPVKVCYKCHKTRVSFVTPVLYIQEGNEEDKKGTHERYEEDKKGIHERYEEDKKGTRERNEEDKEGTHEDNGEDEKYAEKSPLSTGAVAVPFSDNKKISSSEDHTDNSDLKIRSSEEKTEDARILSLRSIGDNLKAHATGIERLGVYRIENGTGIADHAEESYNADGSQNKDNASSNGGYSIEGLLLQAESEAYKKRQSDEKLKEPHPEDTMWNEILKNIRIAVDNSRTDHSDESRNNEKENSYAGSLFKMIDADDDDKEGRQDSHDTEENDVDNGGWGSILGGNAEDLISGLADPDDNDKALKDRVKLDRSSFMYLTAVRSQIFH
ncbi:MAG: hypothetical protein VZR23_05780 [Lachnospiraceae bacterium]|nr:hypothetical protein [Lachnospiraceae bacterium]